MVAAYFSALTDARDEVDEATYSGGPEDGHWRASGLKTR